MKDVNAGKAKPLAIYNKRQRTLYYASTEEQRSEWNRYAQARADEFSASLGPHDSLDCWTSYDEELEEVTGWCPPLSFEDWLEKGVGEVEIVIEKSGLYQLVFNRNLTLNGLPLPNFSGPIVRLHLMVGDTLRFYPMISVLLPLNHPLTLIPTPGLRFETKTTIEEV